MAFALVTGVSRSSDNALAWNHAGRPVAGTILILAALYQLTPLKDVCLGKCRSPLGLLLGSWRDGEFGRLSDGSQERRLVRRLLLGAHGIPLRLGRHERRLDGFVAGLIAIEKTIRSRRIATYGTALILLSLGVLLLAAPDAIPLLTIPQNHPMGHMPSMGS